MGETLGEGERKETTSGKETREGDGVMYAFVPWSYGLASKESIINLPPCYK
jgi:hypothetical protein